MSAQPEELSKNRHEPQIIGGVEIVHDPRLQRLGWAFERVSRFVMAAVLLAALAGLFGNGPLSSTTVSDGSLVVEYERFARLGAAGTYQVNIASDAPRELQLTLSEDLVDAVQIERIEPEPVRAERGEDALRLFLHHPGAGEALVTLHMRPTTFGRVRGMIEAEESGRVTVAHFIYP